MSYFKQRVIEKLAGPVGTEGETPKGRTSLVPGSNKASEIAKNKKAKSSHDLWLYNARNRAGKAELKRYHKEVRKGFSPDVKTRFFPREKGI